MLSVARIIKSLEKKTAILEKKLQESPRKGTKLKSNLDSTIAGYDPEIILIIY